LLSIGDIYFEASDSTFGSQLARQNSAGSHSASNAHNTDHRLKTKVNCKAAARKRQAF
jgi:hypothetical protein